MLSLNFRFQIDESTQIVLNILVYDLLLGNIWIRLVSRYHPSSQTLLFYVLLLPFQVFLLVKVSSLWHLLWQSWHLVVHVLLLWILILLTTFVKIIELLLWILRLLLLWVSLGIALALWETLLVMWRSRLSFLLLRAILLLEHLQLSVDLLNLIHHLLLYLFGPSLLHHLLLELVKLTWHLVVKHLVFIWEFWHVFVSM